MGVDVGEKNVHTRNQQGRGVNRLLRACASFDILYITRNRSADRYVLGRVCLLGGEQIEGDLCPKGQRFNVM